MCSHKVPPPPLLGKGGGTRVVFPADIEDQFADIEDQFADIEDQFADLKGQFEDAYRCSPVVDLESQSED